MKCVIAVVLLLVASSASAGWCGPELVHFYANYDALLCHADLVPNDELRLEVYLESFYWPMSLAEVQFRVEGWLSQGEPPQGEITEQWSADAAAGDLATGITLTWNAGLAPVPGGFGGLNFHLGTISLLPYAADWAEPNHQVRLRDISFRDMEGEEFLGHSDEFGIFTFNAADEPWCANIIWDPPSTPRCEWMLLSPPNGSSVGGNFVFRGEMVFIDCMFGYPVDVVVKLNGTQIGVHHGWNQFEVQQPVDVSGIAEDESFTITVDPSWGFSCAPSYTYTYTLDTTGAAGESFSAIKARY
jgi:hypothetical protein